MHHDAQEVETDGNQKPERGINLPGNASKFYSKMDQTLEEMTLRRLRSQFMTKVGLTGITLQRVRAPPIRVSGLL